MNLNERGLILSRSTMLTDDHQDLRKRTNKEDLHQQIKEKQQEIRNLKEEIAILRSQWGAAEPASRDIVQHRLISKQLEQSKLSDEIKLIKSQIKSPSQLKEARPLLPKHEHSPSHINQRPLRQGSPSGFVYKDPEITEVIPVTPKESSRREKQPTQNPQQSPQSKSSKWQQLFKKSKSLGSKPQRPKR